MPAILSVLLAIPGLDKLLLGLFGLLKDVAIYAKGRSDAKTGIRLQNTEAGLVVAEARRQAELERRLLERAIDRGGAAAAAEQLQRSWRRR
jgi:hypothetical protein